jgi:hypothetical protein
MPIGSDPPTLVVGARFDQLTTRRERVFLFARALKIASMHLSPALRERPGDLDAALLALLGAGAPNHAVPAPDRADELRRKLLRAVPRRARDEVESLALEIRGNADFSAEAVPLACAELGDRVALTLTGDVPSAVDALLKVGGQPLPSTIAARVTTIRRTREAWSLIRFASSDAHFEARAQAGVDP